VELGEEYAGQRFGLGAGKYVTLAVADQGEGMTEEVRSHIFEPFFTTKPKDKGTGLGLATCYGILKQSGGHINAESEPGRGSTFTIYLPAIEAEVALPRPESSRSAPTGGRETVLLVEDEPAVAGMAATALQRSGYDVIQASNGAEALALARRRAGRIDVLLADVVMPQMGGLELAARLAVILPDVRVLLTSGYPHDAMGGNELRPGVAFLQKPFTPAVLAQAVRDVLDRPPSRPGPAASAAV
jgi:CheY-like chemotaxis protein